MTLRTASLLVALVFSAGALASSPGNAVNGKKLFESAKDSKGNAKAACTSCHGPEGNQPLDGMPRLAGQYGDYLSKALKEYQSGKRSNAVMGSQAKGLTEREIADISAYLDSLEGDIHDLSGHAR